MGAGKDDALGDELHVAVIATGFNGSPIERKKTEYFFQGWRPWKIWRCRRVRPGSWRKRSGCASKNWRKVVDYVNNEENSGEMSGNYNGLSCLTTCDDEPVPEEETHRKRIEEYDREFDWRTDANGERMRCRM